MPGPLTPGELALALVAVGVGAAIQGSIGLGASANLDPERRHPSMFEPIHGSAPGIAGQGIANPIGTILVGGMMLNWLGERHRDEELQEAGGRIETTVDRLLADGKILTRDLGGTASTREATDAVCAALGRG